MLAYLRHTSGYSRPQITRVVRWEGNRMAAVPLSKRYRAPAAPFPRKYAKPINAFYEGVFNSWLNLHRPCLYATEVVSEKGLDRKR